MTTMRKATRHLGRLVFAAGTAVMLGLAPAAYANETVALKNALYGAGYHITNVSPQMDDATRAQLTQFQKDHGLQATGILDEEAKKALGMISVQVVAATTSTSGGKAAELTAAPEQKQAAAANKDGASEEDKDGGWKLW